MMLLLGMVGGALTYGALLANFTEVKLIQVVQGTALATMLLNVAALWKQEARDPSRTARDRVQPTFQQAWADFSRAPKAKRRLFALGLGTIAFSMQDILLEPYGGQVLHLTVGTTTILSALLATGGLSGFGLAARLLGRRHRSIPARRGRGFGRSNRLQRDNLRGAIGIDLFVRHRHSADRFRCRTVWPLPP